MEYLCALLTTNWNVYESYIYDEYVRCTRSRTPGERVDKRLEASGKSYGIPISVVRFRILDVMRIMYEDTVPLCW